MLFGVSRVQDHLGVGQLSEDKHGLAMAWCSSCGVVVQHVPPQACPWCLISVPWAGGLAAARQPAAGP